MRVGIEVGGTFTDLLCVEDGKARFLKVPSVPERPDEGAYEALSRATIPLDKVEDLVHGSTVVTNAILERSGARVAFVTTAGFRDILFLQRHNRQRVFDLAYQKPAPLVHRRHCFEVRERMLADGTVAVPLDEDAVAKDLTAALSEGAFEAVAVCLINAYVNPAHEARVAQILDEQLAGVLVTTSADITREFREYERAATTVIATYVRPVVDSYLERFEGFLAKRQFRGRFSLMQSNGGRQPAAGMRSNPVSALFSGPAAGVIGATRQAGRSGFRNLITLDMGGTSTDVCLIEEGAAQIANQTTIGGLPVRTPLYDIVTVGAGCGSIVWIDDGGMLRVGPKSTGAVPGPACYGRGGNLPTVTDAHVVRGTLRPEAFLGGEMAIDEAAARRVFGRLAKTFGLGLEEMASSAIRLTDANILRAIQLVSTQCGHDPRDFTLVAFGGAGPLHAASVAEDLGIRTVLVPPWAGVFSAFGLLSAEYRTFNTITRRTAVDENAPAEVRTIYAGIKERVGSTLGALGLAPEGITFGLTLEMRFVGQAFEVPVNLDPDELPELTADVLMERFVDAHEKLYMHGSAGRQRAEIVAFRLSAASPAPELPSAVTGGDGAVPFREHLIFDNGEATCRLGSRSSLREGEMVSGPAVLEDVTSTIFVPIGWHATQDGCANLVMRRETMP
jgi:N-methylhydantoinase A